MVRIGILLTYPKLEQKKDELLSLKEEEGSEDVQSWTQDADPEFILEYRRKHRMALTGRRGIPADAAVGYYIKNACSQKDVEVDFILPHEITLERLKSNDLNFLLIYDLLEAFHTDKTKGKRVYHALKECLKKADNIYPPLEYQELIYSKIKYYNYLKEHQVGILPTLTMSKEEYQKLGHENAVRKVLEHVQSEEWGEFIAKPVYGQESKDLKFFDPKARGFNKYLEKCMSKYPGIVAQKANKGFGSSTKSPELRMYHIGEEYKYSCCYSNNRVLRPESEGGNLPAPMDKLSSFARSVVRKLPAIVMPNGTRLPRLLTRLDMGYMVDGKLQPFVNEVEFVPSLYVEDMPKPVIRKFIKGLGRQMIRITRRYAKGRALTSRKSLGQKKAGGRKSPTRARSPQKGHKSPTRSPQRASLPLKKRRLGA